MAFQDMQERLAAVYRERFPTVEPLSVRVPGATVNVACPFDDCYVQPRHVVILDSGERFETVAQLMAKSKTRGRSLLVVEGGMRNEGRTLLCRHLVREQFAAPVPSAGTEKSTAGVAILVDLMSVVVRDGMLSWFAACCSAGAAPPAASAGGPRPGSSRSRPGSAAVNSLRSQLELSRSLAGGNAPLPEATALRDVAALAAFFVQATCPLVSDVRRKGLQDGLERGATLAVDYTAQGPGIASSVPSSAAALHRSVTLVVDGLDDISTSSLPAIVQVLQSLLHTGMRLLVAARSGSPAHGALLAMRRTPKWRFLLPKLSTDDCRLLLNAALRSLMRRNTSSDGENAEASGAVTNASGSSSSSSSAPFDLDPSFVDCFAAESRGDRLLLAQRKAGKAQPAMLSDDPAAADGEGGAEDGTDDNDDPDSIERYIHVPQMATKLIQPVHMAASSALKPAAGAAAKAVSAAKPPPPQAPAFSAVWASRLRLEPVDPAATATALEDVMISEAYCACIGLKTHRTHTAVRDFAAACRMTSMGLLAVEGGGDGAADDEDTCDFLINPPQQAVPEAKPITAAVPRQLTGSAAAASDANLFAPQLQQLIHWLKQTVSRTRFEHGVAENGFALYGEVNAAGITALERTKIRRRWCESLGISNAIQLGSVLSKDIDFFSLRSRVGAASGRPPSSGGAPRPGSAASSMRIGGGRPVSATSSVRRGAEPLTHGSSFFPVEQEFLSLFALAAASCNAHLLKMIVGCARDHSSDALGAPADPQDGLVGNFGLLGGDGSIEDSYVYREEVLDECMRIAVVQNARDVMAFLAKHKLATPLALSTAAASVSGSEEAAGVLRRFYGGATSVSDALRHLLHAAQSVSATQSLAPTSTAVKASVESLAKALCVVANSGSATMDLDVLVDALEHAPCPPGAPQTSVADVLKGSMPPGATDRSLLLCAVDVILVAASIYSLSAKHATALGPAFVAGQCARFARRRKQLPTLPHLLAITLNGFQFGGAIESVVLDLIDPLALEWLNQWQAALPPGCGVTRVMVTNHHHQTRIGANSFLCSKQPSRMSHVHEVDFSKLLRAPDVAYRAIAVVRSSHGAKQQQPPAGRAGGGFSRPSSAASSVFNPADLLFSSTKFGRKLPSYVARGAEGDDDDGDDRAMGEASKAVQPGAVSEIVAIEANFLFNCCALDTIDLSAFGQVQVIGANFLHKCAALRFIDLRPLKALRSIGECFLYKMPSLVALSLWGHGHVSSIGPRFVCYCSSLATISDGEVPPAATGSSSSSNSTSRIHYFGASFGGLLTTPNGFLQRCDDLYRPQSSGSTAPTATCLDCRTWTKQLLTISPGFAFDGDGAARPAKDFALLLPPKGDWTTSEVFDSLAYAADKAKIQRFGRAAEVEMHFMAAKLGVAPPPQPAQTLTQQKAPTPTVGKAPTPVAEKAPTPAVETATTPIVAKASTPVAAKAPTPAGEKAPTPSTEKAPTPTVEKAPTPVAEKAAIPVAEKAATPTVEKAPTPAAEKAPTPAVEKAATPSAEKAPTPVTEKAATPVTEKAATPAVEKATTPAIEKAATPIAEKTPTPAGEKAPTPSAEKALTPAVEKAAAPTTEKAPTPVTEMAATPAVEKAPTPAVEKAPTPVTEKAPTPIAAKAPTPAVEKAPIPTIEKTATPVAEKSATPAAEKDPTPGVEKASTPAFEKASTPAVEKASTPAFEKASTPAVEKASTPAVEKAPTPAVAKAPTPGGAGAPPQDFTSLAQQEAAPARDAEWEPQAVQPGKKSAIKTMPARSMSVESQPWPSDASGRASVMSIASVADTLPVQPSRRGHPPHPDEDPAFRGTRAGKYVSQAYSNEVANLFQ